MILSVIISGNNNSCLSATKEQTRHANAGAAGALYCVLYVPLLLSYAACSAPNEQQQQHVTHLRKYFISTNGKRQQKHTQTRYNVLLPKSPTRRTAHLKVSFPLSLTSLCFFLSANSYKKNGVPVHTVTKKTRTDGKKKKRLLQYGNPKTRTRMYRTVGKKPIITRYSSTGAYILIYTW